MAPNCRFSLLLLHTPLPCKRTVIISSKFGTALICSLTEHTFPIVEFLGLQLIVESTIPLIRDGKDSMLRFKLFSDKNMFECKRHLSEICSLKNGYAFKSSTYNSDGMYNIVTIANVTGTRYISSVCNKITDVPSDIQMHQQLCFNDILISMTGNVGRVSLCDEGYDLQNQRVGLITVLDNVNKELIFQVLSTERFENEMIAKAQGAAQMNISKFDIESYIIPYTSNTQIIDNVATLLKLYDEKILVSEDLLSSFTKQKQSLLHQMFI